MVIYQKMIELEVEQYLDRNRSSQDISGNNNSIIERFDCEREITKGKTHRTWKARRIIDDKWYVIKEEIPDNRESSTTIINEFSKAELLIRDFRHPNIVKYIMNGTIISYGSDGCKSTRKALVIEYIEGQNLYDYVTETRQKKPLIKRTALSYISQLFGALRYLHSDCQIVHRDIKARNIIRTESGSLVLIDFGTAKTIGSGMELNSGTNGYKPKNSLCRATTDIYGVGMVLYFLLTGEEPKENLSMDDIQSHNFDEDINNFFAQILPIYDLTEDDF